MRFNCVIRDEKFLVDVEMASSMVVIQSGTSDAPKFSRYHVQKTHTGDTNWSNLQRAERIAETAVDYFGATPHFGDKVQNIPFNAENATSRGSLAFVG